MFQVLVSYALRLWQDRCRRSEESGIARWGAPSPPPPVGPKPSEFEAPGSGFTFETQAAVASLRVS